MKDNNDDIDDIDTDTDDLIDLTELHDDDAIEDALSSPEKALQFAKYLRREYFQAKHVFYSFLEMIESHEHLWTPLAGSFAEWLRKTHLVAAHLYHSWQRGRNVLGEQLASTLGHYASENIARIPDKRQQEAAVARMVQTYESEGVPLSEHAARNAVKPYVRSDSPTKVPYAKLKARVRQLESENKRLRALVCELGGDPSDVDV